jgi:hypothetical protein
MSDLSSMQWITNNEPKKRVYTRDCPIGYTRNGDVYRIPEKEKTWTVTSSWTDDSQKPPIH